MKPAVLETSRHRYVVGDFLTEGGMGAIYHGRRIAEDGADEEVILKALLPEYTSQPQFVDLFLREARLTAGFDHPNIVRTLDLVAGEGGYYIVMEYVRGADLRTLAKRARRRGRSLAPAASIYAGVEILGALDYAHGRADAAGKPLGLIHRDVSPSNILAAGDGAVKLSDFGIAKLSSHRSVFYKVKGKVGYMSPEQARGEPVDHRSDLFSLAVCVYEGIVGERLYASTPMATPRSLYARPPARASERCPSLTPALDRVMAKALAFAPSERFQSAAEMRDALSRAASAASLLYRREDMARHLAEALGADPRRWLRGEPEAAGDREAGTEAYALEDSDGDLDRVAGGDRDDGDWSAERPRQSTLITGVSLESIIELEDWSIHLVEEPPLPGRSVHPARREDDDEDEGDDAFDSEDVTRIAHRAPPPSRGPVAARLLLAPPSPWLPATPVAAGSPALEPLSPLPATIDAPTTLHHSPLLRARDVAASLDGSVRHFLIVGSFTFTLGVLVGTVLGFVLAGLRR